MYVLPIELDKASPTGLFGDCRLESRAQLSIYGFSWGLGFRCVQGLAGFR